MTNLSDVIEITTGQLEDISTSNTALGGSLNASNTEYSAFLFSCGELDKVILDRLDEINIRKNQIVSILTDNYDKLVANCAAAPKDPGVSGVSSGSFVPASSIKGDACLISSSLVSVASSVVVSGTLTTFNYNCQLFIDGSGGVGLGTTYICDTGVKGEIREETIYSLIYPYLEDIDVSVEEWSGLQVLITDENLPIKIDSVGPIVASTGDPLGFHTYVGLGTTNLGIGNKLFQFTDVNDKFSIHKNKSNLIGYYYPIDDVGCASTVSNIQTLENEILEIRVGIVTLLSSSNTARVIKVNSHTDIWWVTRTQQDNADSESNINTLVTDLGSLPPTP